MKQKLLPFIIFIALLTLVSCIQVPEATVPSGCYRFALPDPGSPDPNPPLTELYLQFWDDGTGEGGFWDPPLCESDFFSWEIVDDVITFTSTPWFSNGKFTYIEIKDTSSYILYSQNDSEITKIYLSDAVVPRIDFLVDDIVGSWSNTRGQIYTFTEDSVYRAAHSPTAWNKSYIPHVIETQYGQEWAVRTEGQDTIICAGYNNVLRKQ